MRARPDEKPLPSRRLPVSESRPRRVLRLLATLTVLGAVAGAVAWILPEHLRAAAPAGKPPPPRVSRAAVEEGRSIVKLGPAERRQIGVETVTLRSTRHREERQAYGAVLDLARVTDLTNSYASARAQLMTAQARLEVSRSAYQRAKALGPYATAVQVESAEGTFRTDDASLAAAESQLRTLAATAQQEWGPVLGRAIVERSALVTGLIERARFLVQVTLPPGESVGQPPVTAYAELPPQSARVPLDYVSPATRTDQRIQGLSYFYTVAGDSGFLPGMSSLVFVPSAKSVSGVAVPEDAIVHWQGGAWFYRSVGPDAFARHPLDTGGPMSDDSFVVAGLPDETEIVLRGAQALLSEEMKSQLRVSGDDD
ncbi:efflux RND transporter periplasmic adaptor subunit [Methylobacterium sp. ID0610]|uniref:efflux RND transporter periplasmic adaptor subunit n=1 Tax=Methylobacterium carpenticola TaxID=3344827 RepID=UPI0036C684FC